MEQLKEIYHSYIRSVDKLLEDSPAFAGFWGWGDDPKKDPCHMAFYEAVEERIKALLQADPSEEALFEAVDWIIRTPAQHKDTPVFWYMFAAHGLCRELVPLLSPAHCAALRDFYDAGYPKRDRLPVQQQLYKLLKKRAGKL